MMWSTTIRSVIVFLFLYFILAGADLAVSQIAIDSSDFQSIILSSQRTAYRIEYYPNPLLDLGTTSPTQQLFDFSSVPNEDSRDSRVQNFVDPTVQPGSVFFPGATHCTPQVSHPNDSSEITVVSYFRLQEDGFYEMGNYIRQIYSTSFDTTVVQRYLPMRIMVPLPLGYGIERSGLDTVIIDSANNDYVVTSISIDCDGWGDVTVPSIPAVVPFSVTSGIACLRLTRTRIDESYAEGGFSDREKWVEVEYITADGSVLTVSQNDSNYLDGNAAVESIEYSLRDNASSAGSFSSDIPHHYSLSQNYPNPFNPATSIAFTLPASGHVQLSVFDVIGREVATVVDREMPPGSYVVPFEAVRLTSGVYVYRLWAGGAVLMNKMNIIR